MTSGGGTSGSYTGFGVVRSTEGTPQPRRRRGTGSLIWWIVFLIGFLYFFLPLVGALEFSLRTTQPFGAYTNAISDPGFARGLIYSFTVGVITIIASLALIVLGDIDR